ncbi:MAG TPA: cysteine peptidase family C39 domain-containing protein, partial [Clostridia bacterium]|nr:cysteine peptidase family C39 domain-containing protein [Clostridia bacterium]
MRKTANKPATKGVAKVPVVMQLETLECGAASLAMVLAYYGKWLPLERVRADCGISRDGSSARNILIAARSHGLKAKGYRYEPDALKKSGSFPCIVHWNFNHFVVLCGFRGKHAHINDPARGAVRVPMEEFDRSFTGVCMVFSPTSAFVPGGRPRSVLAFAKERLLGTGAAFAFVAVTALIATLIGMIRPAFSRIFLDRLLTQQNPSWLYPFLLALAGLTALSLAAQALQAVYSEKIEGKLAIVANASFLWHVLCLPMEFFSQRAAGDIAGRAAENQDIASTLVHKFAPVALDFAMLVLYLTIMLRYSAILTLVGIGSIAVNL